MKLIKSAFILALAGGLATGLPALANTETPQVPRDTSVMDRDNDGVVQKREFLSYMGERFDRQAGSKGHLTVQEADGWQNMPGHGNLYQNNPRGNNPQDAFPKPTPHPAS